MTQNCPNVSGDKYVRFLSLREGASCLIKYFLYSAYHIFITDNFQSQSFAIAAFNMFGYWLARGANSPGEMLPMGEDDLAGVPSLTQPNENLSSTQEAVTEPINCFENDCVVEALRWQNDDWDEYGNASLCDQSTDSLKESIVSVISHMSDDLVKLAIPAHIDESCLASQPDDIVGEDDNATVLPVLGSAQGDGTDEWTMDDLGHSMEMQMASDAATLARIREDYISEYGDFDVGVALVPKPGHPNELPPEPIHPNEPPPQPIHEDCKLNSTGEKTAVLSSNKSSYRTLLPKTQDINKVGK